MGGGKAISVAADNIHTNNIETNAGETNSMKSTKKRKSKKKAKTPAEEDTQVLASDANNVEPIKAVDPDNVIRNVLGSLQEENETLMVH